MPSCASPRILAEALETPSEPLALLGAPLVTVSARDASLVAARALLDLPESAAAPPTWLSPHQVPAFTRIVAILARFGGAVLADAVGSGKSYVALAVAQAEHRPLVLVVPAVLAGQWRALLDRLLLSARIETHERLSRERLPLRSIAPGSLVVIDEAHHFRNPETRRYGALARLVIHSRVLLVSATPVHNRPADLLQLLRLFLRDDALVGFGVPSLAIAARDSWVGPEALAAVARLVVARSRRRVMQSWAGMRFPERLPGSVIHRPTAEPARVAALIEGIQQLRPPGAGALHRLTLLRRLASSIPALRESLRRYEAFRTIAREAALLGRSLTPREFHRAFAMEDEADLQLTLLPVLLEPGDCRADDADDLSLIRRLLEAAQAGQDPKAAALADRLASREGKTIVFTGAAATVRHLRRSLSPSLRVGALCGTGGWLGNDRVPRDDVLRAFAPGSLGVAPPPARERVDVLLATDLIGEGLNLHDARCVIHYDLPWSPARLAQRVGRVDRLGSPHAAIETVTFLPDESLDRALDIEARLAAKIAIQVSAGAAQVETTSGDRGGDAAFDWCDRLQRLAGERVTTFRDCVRASGAAGSDAVVLVIALGADVEAIVVEGDAARADPEYATALLERAQEIGAPPCDNTVVRALQVAAPIIRERLSGIAAARWRAADRDRPGRRLIPMVLAAARRAAKTGHADRLARLDGLVARLTTGLSAGEGLLLADLIAGRVSFDVAQLLSWHDRLPPISTPGEAPIPRVVAAIRLFNAP